MDIVIRNPIPRHKRKRYAVYLWFLSAISVYLFVGCMSIGEFDGIAQSVGTTCACNGSTLECTDSEGVLHTEPNSDVCNETLLNSQEDICACEGTTLECDYYLCKIKVPATTCLGRFAGQYEVTACDSLKPISGQEITGTTELLYLMHTDFSDSPQCDVPDIAITPQTPNSGTLPTSTAAPQGGGVPATSAPDVCANNGGVANVSEICTCQGVIDRVVFCGDGTKIDNITSTACTPDASLCQTGGDTGGQPTCTLTVEQCNAQGFGQVDLATCTCYGNYKP